MTLERFTDEEKALITRLTNEHVPFDNIAIRLSKPKAWIQAFARENKLIYRDGATLNRKQMAKVQTADEDANVFRTATALLTHYGRYEERNGNMFLDGVPSNLTAVMKAYNKYQRAYLLPMVTTNEAWLPSE